MRRGHHPKTPAPSPAGINEPRRSGISEALLLNKYISLYKNWMKRHTIFVIALFALLAAIALYAGRWHVIEFIRDPLCEETATKHYPTREDAATQIRLGWLPQLPPSTRDIREKRNIDYGTIVVEFSFQPQEFPTAFPAMTLLDASRARQTGPRWIVRRADWVPADIRTGRTDAMLAQGFQLYHLNQPVGGKRWYLLVNPIEGIAYGWNSNEG